MPKEIKNINIFEWVNILLMFKADITSPCCKNCFHCADCHNKQCDHSLKKTNEMTFAVKLVKKFSEKTCFHLNKLINIADINIYLF